MDTLAAGNAGSNVQPTLRFLPARTPTIMIAILYSVFYWLFLAVTSIALFPVAVFLRIVTDPFDRRLTLLHRFTSFWGSLYTLCNPFWRISLKGTMPRDRPYIIVANHQSMVDIPLLFRLPLHYKWVSKAEMFRIPFIGWNMSLNRYVKIRRGTKSGNLRMMRECERALREGSSVMIFPEGTRSPDGTLRSFKDGAFELAVRFRLPILPIVIRGTSDALPKKGFVLGMGCDIEVQVLAPIEPSSFEGASTGEVRERVHTLFVAALGEGIEESKQIGGATLSGKY